MVIGLAVVGAWRVPTAAQQQPRQGLVAMSGRSLEAVRDASTRVTSMRRNGELRMRMSREDRVVPGRLHERLDQFHRGVRVFGADVAVQYNRSQVVSVFGNVYDDIDIDPTPTIDIDRAREIIEDRTGLPLATGEIPELVVLPREGERVLAWRVRAASSDDYREYFINARTGGVALDFSAVHTQSAVGRGTGVLGDTKKVSVSSSGGQYVASDVLRPPAIVTYDLKGDHVRAANYVTGRIQLTANDRASDADNTWTDGMTVDAHAYIGLTYDYFFKRFERRGLDNRDRAISVVVHPAKRDDVLQNFQQFSTFYTNAAYWGNGVVSFGVGLPTNLRLGGQSWDYTSGSLDLVAHELTHGVTDYSSDLIYQNESGALNESFSDVMGTSVEFFFEQPGSGSQRADYLVAEDVVRPGGFRSLADPMAYGDPDHYSRRYTGTDDNGGVHINSGIPNQAFYLAIEGGTNRTSGLSVQGVGAANRVQIERVFYRAFTQLLPSNATFATARQATLQAARDIFGNNSNAERALTEAWTAVGVN
jgi:thermolysin